MSKRTAARKPGSTGGMFSMREMGEIRHRMQMSDLERKRKQEKFNKSSRRRKDGSPYQAADELASGEGYDCFRHLRDINWRTDSLGNKIPHDSNASYRVRNFS